MNYSSIILTTLKDKIPLARSSQNYLDLSMSTPTIPEKTKFFGHFSLKPLLFRRKFQILLVNNYLIFNK